MKCSIWEIETDFANYRREDDNIKIKVWDKDGPELSLSPEQWTRLIKEMPSAIRILTAGEQER
jgi:hypothetical protein